MVGNGPQMGGIDPKWGEWTPNGGNRPQIVGNRPQMRGIDLKWGGIDLKWGEWTPNGGELSPKS